jgi:molybdate transport system regulatory protein
MMKRKTSPARLPALHPRFRIVCGKVIAFGPGKADLLELIAETGSIGKAASRMKMSYMRAWLLVQTMNQLLQASRSSSPRTAARAAAARN